MAKRGTLMRSMAKCAQILVRPKTPLGHTVTIVARPLLFVGMLVSADILWGAKLTASKVPNYAAPLGEHRVCFEKDYTPAQNAKLLQQCQKNADIIIAAYDKWKEHALALGWQVPAYIDREYILRVTAIESDMGRLNRTRLPNGRLSRFRGPDQNDPTDPTDTYYQNWNLKAEILTASKADIPALKNIGKITQSALKDHPALADDVIFSTYMQLTDAIGDGLHLNNRFSQFSTETDSAKRALSYYAHNLPATLGPMIKNGQCSWGIVDLVNAKKAALYYRENSGLYQREGQANAAEVITRFQYLTNDAVEKFAPPETAYQRMAKFFGWKDPRTNITEPRFRPGQQGVLHYITGTLADNANCPEQKLSETRVAAANAQAPVPPAPAHPAVNLPLPKPKPVAANKPTAPKRTARRTVQVAYAYATKQARP